MRIINKVLRQLIIAGICCQSSAAFAKDSLSAKDILIQHDAEAVKIYDQLKDKYIKKTDPILIAQGDKFILYHQGTISKFSIVSPQYVNLTSVSHVILATFALFNPLNQFPKNKAEVIEYKRLLMDTEKAIASLPLTKGERVRQEKIILLTKQFIQKALDENSSSPEQLDKFFQKLSPLIKQNMKDAVQAQLAVIEHQMKVIDGKLSKEERKKLFVVIPVSKAPRKDNLIGQYFSKHLNEPIDSSRLIFAEGLSDTNAILNLVGGWQIEADLSKMFFHNPDTMKKDILGKDTKEQLQKL